MQTQVQPSRVWTPSPHTKEWHLGERFVDAVELRCSWGSRQNCSASPKGGRGAPRAGGGGRRPAGRFFRTADSATGSAPPGARRLAALPAASQARPLGAEWRLLRTPCYRPVATLTTRLSLPEFGEHLAELSWNELKLRSLGPRAFLRSSR